MPDGLGSVDIPGDYKMVGEDGSTVYQDVVLPAFSALEGKGVLVLHVVFLAERAAVVEDGKAAGI